jgi:L-lactate dehydrogenase complex protein LldE
VSSSKTVTLFIQCLVDTIYPEVAQAMVQVFRRMGIAVICPTDQTCCGQPAFNSGYRQSARVAAKHFIEVFADTEQIVCPSGSCVNMVRHHYVTLFQNDSRWLQRAQNLAGRIYEFSEYLVDVLGVEDLGVRFDGKVTYHDSCHLLRGIGVQEQPRKLLTHVLGTELVEMYNSDYCCGFGGAFSVKYPDISNAMVGDKVKNIIDTGADTVVGCDMGCLMNIQGKLSRMGCDIKVMHLAQILAS